MGRCLDCDGSRCDECIDGSKFTPVSVDESATELAIAKANGLTFASVKDMVNELSRRGMAYAIVYDGTGGLDRDSFFTGYNAPKDVPLVKFIGMCDVLHREIMEELMEDNND